MAAPADRLPIGYSLVTLGTVVSTNDEARQRALAGAADGTVISALSQAGGRGRDGRIWESPPGNLYFSLILRPDCPVGQAAQLGFVAAVALGEALAPILPDPKSLALKWPNDLLLGGAKLSGILLESQMAAGGRIDWVVAGIGVNLLSAPKGAGFVATSLAAQAVAERPEDLLARFVGEFARWRGRWREQGFAPVRAAWMARAWQLGETITARLPGGITQCGIHRGIDESGLLQLDTFEAGRVTIAAADVFPPRQPDAASCC